VGRIRGNGIKLAYVRRRDIAVSFDPLDERATRSYAHELAWADQIDLEELLDTLPPLPPYCGR
jgi:hypothetical protein